MYFGFALNLGLSTIILIFEHNISISIYTINHTFSVPLPLLVCSEKKGLKCEIELQAQMPESVTVNCLYYPINTPKWEKKSFTEIV